jgi:hypothetical protein
MSVFMRFRFRSQPTPLIATRGKLSEEGNNPDTFPLFSVDVKFVNTSSNIGIFEHTVQTFFMPQQQIYSVVSLRYPRLGDSQSIHCV